LFNCKQHILKLVSMHVKNKSFRSQFVILQCQGFGTIEKCISYQDRLHNILILCVCLALDNWVHSFNWALHFDKRIYVLHPIEFGPLKIILAWKKHLDVDWIPNIMFTYFIGIFQGSPKDLQEWGISKMSFLLFPCWFGYLHKLEEKAIFGHLLVKG
jgi:hypothetical protein